MKKILMLLAAMLLLLPSCRNQPDIDYADPVDSSWSSMFDAYWKNMNKNYVLFELDYFGDGWDRVYDEYAPKFAELGKIGADERETRTALRYFFDIVKNLADGHYGFTFMVDVNEGNAISVDTYRYRIYHEAGLSDDEIFSICINEKTEADVTVPTALNERVEHVFSNTFGIADIDQTAAVNRGSFLNGRSFKGTFISLPFSAGSETRMHALLGVIDNRIAYLGFDRFRFTGFLTEAGDNAVKSICDEYLGYINSNEIEAIIFDIRGNDGGYMSDLNILFGGLIKDELAYMKQKIKDGPNRDDFSHWSTMTISPIGESNYGKPIAVLFNRASISCSEASLMIFREMKETLGMDIRTFGTSNSAGATCSLNIASIPGAYGTEYYPVQNSGVFIIKPHMLTVYTPDTVSVGADGTCYERIGFSPDVRITLDSAYMNAFRAGQDPVLTAALEWIEAQ